MNKKEAGRLGGLSRAKKYAEKRKKDMELKEEQSIVKQQHKAKDFYCFSNNAFDKLR